MVEEREILAQLAKESTRGDGFRLLVARYREPIYWHIRRLVVRHEDAEDVMQEAFINVYRFIGSFKGDSSLKTWIYRIATNEALRHLSRQRLMTDSYDHGGRLVELFGAEVGVDFDSAEAQLQAAILALPERQRLVFNMRYFDSLSYEEIAQVTGSSVAALKSNYHYAQSKIKECLIKNLEERI